MLFSPIYRREIDQHIDAWKHSELTEQDYCEQQRITISNFYYWLKITIIIPILHLPRRHLFRPGVFPLMLIVLAG